MDKMCVAPYFIYLYDVHAFSIGVAKERFLPPSFPFGKQTHTQP